MHDFGQKMTTSDILHCLFTFRRSSKFTDPVWPRTYLYHLNWWFWGSIEVLRPNTWLKFHIDMFYSAPLHHRISLRVNDTVYPRATLPLGDIVRSRDEASRSCCISVEVFIGRKHIKCNISILSEISGKNQFDLIWPQMTWRRGRWVKNAYGSSRLENIRQF